MKKQVIFVVQYDDEDLTEGIYNTFDELYDGAHIVAIYKEKKS